MPVWQDYGAAVVIKQKAPEIALASFQSHMQTAYPARMLLLHCLMVVKVLLIGVAITSQP